MTDKAQLPKFLGKFLLEVLVCGSSGPGFGTRPLFIDIAYR